MPRSGLRTYRVILEVPEAASDAFTRLVELARSNPATESISSMVRNLRSLTGGGSASRPAAAPSNAGASNGTASVAAPPSNPSGARAHLGTSAANPVDLTGPDDGVIVSPPPQRRSTTLIELDDDVHLVTTHPHMPPGGPMFLVAASTASGDRHRPVPWPTSGKRRHPSSTSTAAGAAASPRKHHDAGGGGGGGGGDSAKRLEVQCSICLDVIKQMSSTRCGHVFCAPCIGEALSKSKTCPTCREKLKPKDVHRVYI
eukprot:jgi/Mesvir1/20905/Mv07979-RA.1